MPEPKTEKAKIRLLNIGAIMNGTPNGVRANDIRLPNGKVAENVRIFAFEDELPPEMFCRLDLDAVVDKVAGWYR